MITTKTGNASDMHKHFTTQHEINLHKYNATVVTPTLFMQVFLCFCFFSSTESERCFKFGCTVEWMEKCRQMKNCIKSVKRLNVSWVDESLTSNTRQAHSFGPNHVPQCNNPPWTIKNWETILWVCLASLACLCWKRNITV